MRFCREFMAGENKQGTFTTAAYKRLVGEVRYQKLSKLKDGTAELLLVK